MTLAQVPIQRGRDRGHSVRLSQGLAAPTEGPGWDPQQGLGEPELPKEKKIPP